MACILGNSSTERLQFIAIWMGFVIIICLWVFFIPIQTHLSHISCTFLGSFPKINDFPTFFGFTSPIHPNFCTISSITDFLVCVFFPSNVLLHYFCLLHVWLSIMCYNPEWRLRNIHVQIFLDRSSKNNEFLMQWPWSYFESGVGGGGAGNTFFSVILYLNSVR